MVNNIGITWALIGAVIWGMVYNIDQKILVKTTPLTMFIVGGVMQMIILLPYIFTNQGKTDIFSLLEDRSRLILLFVSEILLIIAGIVILYAVKHLGAPTAAIFEIIYPFFVVLFSYMFFGGSLNVNFIIGSVLIFFGSFIIMK